MPLKRPSAIEPLLLEWYDLHRRELPWRAKPGEAADPYRVWLSEVMLQQTTVATVRPRFQAWVARWPDVASLAAADEAAVMSAWAGLGYYARARNLVLTARAVAAAGGFPTTEGELRRLPGLGNYTAAAVAAIAFGQRAVVVDANVERVVARLAAIDAPLPGGRAAIRAAADAVTPETRAGDFAQGMMDLGATICTPRKPRCLLCPLDGECAAQATGAPEAFPVKAAKKPRPQRYGTVFWLEREVLANNSPRQLPGEGRGPVTMVGPSGSSSASVALLGPGLRRGTPNSEAAVSSSAQNQIIREVLLLRRPSRGLLGGMRALPTGAWVDVPPGLEGAPAAADWRVLAETVEHGFTHFTLQLALAVGEAREHVDGEWWPIDRLDEAGLPTLFARAAEAMRRGR